jgi:hypothetical protein
LTKTAETETSSRKYLYIGVVMLAVAREIAVREGDEVAFASRAGSKYEQAIRQGFVTGAASAVLVEDSVGSVLVEAALRDGGNNEH